MKSNEALQKEIQDAIKWEPKLHAAEIGVVVHEGIVTLSGTVDNYSKKLQAEEATKNIQGVKAVVEQIEVQFDTDWAKHDDSDIAREIVNAYRWNWQLPKGMIHVKVENGWVTLDGETNWNYQREEAKNCIKNFTGIKGVNNHIKIKLEVESKLEKNQIEAAIQRNLFLKNEHVAVAVMDHRVTLTGTVSTWYQKEEAARMVWSAPGVWSVENDLRLFYD